MAVAAAHWLRSRPAPFSRMAAKSLRRTMMMPRNNCRQSGDAGDTLATRASRRYGFEWTNHCRPWSWIDIGADLAMTHARFRGYDSGQAEVYASLAGYPEAQIGNAPGNYIPNAPADGGLGRNHVWREDGMVRNLALALSGGQYVPFIRDQHLQRTCRLPRRQRLARPARGGQSLRQQSETRSLMPMVRCSRPIRSTIPAPVGVAPTVVCQNGVMDYVMHPVEPLAFRLSVAGRF